ncbi:MAG TPA: archaellum operon transcriptional activator EarA family protein [Candidatus Thermoplasmatota archaeon]|nr:archaellum operon transcriptional activator EarA family protein [Candidatus Thermoplasmatota archaeon]
MNRRRVTTRMIRLSLVRSRIKLRILFALLDLGEASLADLAREARAKPAHVEGALFGDGVAFRTSTALVALGLVRVRESVFSRTATLTPRGRSVATVWRRESTRATLGLARHPHA